MNIFIASLPYAMEETEIREIFEDYGLVNSVKLITDKDTGKSKGYGFINMPNDDEALKAIEILNGTEIYERNISVSKALDKKDYNNKKNQFLDSRTKFNQRNDRFDRGNNTKRKRSF